MEGVQAWAGDALIRYGHTDEIPPLGVYGSKGGRYMTSHAVIKWKEYRRGLEMRSSGTAILMKYLLLESTDQREGQHLKHLWLIPVVNEAGEGGFFFD